MRSNNNTTFVTLFFKENSLVHAFSKLKHFQPSYSRVTENYISAHPSNNVCFNFSRNYYFAILSSPHSEVTEELLGGKKALTYLEPSEHAQINKVGRGDSLNTFHELSFKILLLISQFTKIYKEVFTSLFLLATAL
jgi:hypothetical protein